MQGYSIRLAKERDALRLAELHMANLPDAFLTSLGKTFLSYLYRSFATSADAFCVVADSGGKVVGFATGAEDIGTYYRHVVKRHFIRVGAIIIFKMFIPKTARKVLENIFYPARVQKDLPRAEFLTLGVDGEFRGKGIGEALFEGLTDEFRRRGVHEFKAVVSDWLSGACRFHERHGGVVAAEIELHKGERSRVYVWKL